MEIWKDTKNLKDFGLRTNNLIFKLISVLLKVTLILSGLELNFRVSFLL